MKKQKNGEKMKHKIVEDKFQSLHVAPSIGLLPTPTFLPSASTSSKLKRNGDKI
jgi:hypothetical protein